VTSLSLSEARRIALAAQGFDRPRPSGRIDARHVRKVIRQLGLIQIDFVNVLVPAHYQVLFSRLGRYDRPLLDRVVYQRREFTEHWAHEASIIPMESWPLLAYRRESHRARPWNFAPFIESNPQYVAWVLEQVRERGPLRADEIAAPSEGLRRIPDSWFSSVPRAVLEYHFGRGLLAIADRGAGFARSYDLSERVIPDQHRVSHPGRNDAQLDLVRLASRAHGVATAADLADYYRMPVPAVRPHIAELVNAGELIPVQVEGWREAAYLHSAARLPRAINSAALLSPFDPVVWFRPRAARLFGFDHRFEIFVPAHKRKWGVYVLPFLLGDRLVARVDLKADRTAKRLLVPATYIEPHSRKSEVMPALMKELRELARWLDLKPPAAL
jgi:uncharacterized protein YcaQ